MNDVFLLIYTSKATKPTDQKFIDEILEVSRRRNAQNDLTGFLVLRHQYFLQLLEGDEEKVRATFARIHKDSRHRNIVLQGEALTDERILPDWSMGLIRPEEKSDAPEGLLTLFETARGGRKYSSLKPLEAMLRIFAQDAQIV